MPGIGLLLLRATLGIAAVVQGQQFVADPTRLTLGTCALAVVTVACGLLLVTGLLTQAAGTVNAAVIAGLALSLLPSPKNNLFDAHLSVAFAEAISAATVLLGPGAFSIDARLFGRREIIISASYRTR